MITFLVLLVSMGVLAYPQKFQDQFGSYWKYFVKWKLCTIKRNRLDNIIIVTFSR